MKAVHVAALAALGMFLTGASVYSITPAGGFQISADSSEPAPAASEPAALIDAEGKLGEMTAGTTLRVEGRVGFKTLAKGGTGETHVLLEVGTGAATAGTRAPVNLAIVVDRSGSMKGNRLRNAISGALSAVERLSDGDVVSVVAFDAKPAVVVSPTTIDPSSRNRIRSDIQGITLGGDTCISCGIEEGMALLERTPGRVSRMIVLSDGEATAGVRDLPGFRSIAQRASSRGTGITTIGVDVDYNERILSTIALDSNGRHYFVANDSGLEKVFDTEAQSLTTAVASNAEVSVELPPGVELVRVVDRTFRRSGNRVFFPLGVFTAGDTKSVLLQVKVPADREGTVPVANVDLTFRDHTTNTDARCGGKLDVAVSPAGASEVDGVVEARVNRTATADVLKEASELFKQGRAEEARRKLAARQQGLASVAATATSRSPAAKVKGVKKDLDAQEAAIQQAQTQFATPPPVNAALGAAPADPFASRVGKEAVKQNAEAEVNLRR